MDKKQLMKEMEEYLGQLSFKDRFLFRISRYVPSIIRRRILMRYVQLIVPKTLEFAFRQAKDEMGDETFQKMLDQIPTKIKDKDGVWTLPAGTTRDGVAEFLMQLREKGLDKEEEK